MASDTAVGLTSIVLLTYNRPNELKRNLLELNRIERETIEIIVVDNHSDSPVQVPPEMAERVRVLRMDANRGVGGRNVGISVANGEYIITLDDDVFGLECRHIGLLKDKFKDPSIAALTFRIVDDVTGEQVNWVHHRVIEQFGEAEFETYEISEGAVAFRRSILAQTDIYPEEFFISHEGPDLAVRLINLGAKIIYFPSVTVRHSHSPVARAANRRYYFDTRNLIWYAVRCLPVDIACRELTKGLGAMLIYALRDGQILAWIKGVLDGLKRCSCMYRRRIIITPEARARLLRMRAQSAPISYIIKRRLFRRGVRI